MISLSNTLLMLISEKPLDFPSIRKAMEQINGADRKVLWSTLERLVKKGCLKKNKKTAGFVFSITPAGKKNLPKDPACIKRPVRAWDGKWRMVIFDIKESKRKIRDLFTTKIKQIGFGRMQNSVYISPHDANDLIKDIAKNLKIEDSITMILIEDLGVKELPKFAENVWHLDELNKKYQEFIKNHKNSHKNIEYNEEVLKLWLKKTRYEYLSILHEDPILPKELLSKNWLGYEAENVWQQLEKILATY